jgi:glycosyltransferase involved in cell wall biosynthesis
MGWCFANCTGFIMTSRIEACPNTVLEALNYGAPSISTTERPMPDFFKANAIYYEAGNSGQLASRMNDILELDPAARGRQAELSKARAREFSWEETTSATAHQLSLAAQHGRGTRGRGSKP